MTVATLAPKAAARRPVPLARQIRDWHAYLGALIAPTVLFFGTTGVVQLWSLHEAHGGYNPPALIEMLGVLHKDQKFAMGHHHEPAAAKPAAKAHKPDQAPEAPKPAVILLKAFFTAAATGLIASTVAGIWMALSQSPRRRTLAILLLIGAATPVVLAALSA